MFEKRRIRKHGQPAEATVVHAQQQPKVTTNDFRKYDFIVDVRPQGGQPFRTEIQETFTVGGMKPAEGDVVKVICDPAAQKAIFDLDGDPRYDLEALRAQQEAERQALLREPPAQ